MKSDCRPTRDLVDDRWERDSCGRRPIRVVSGNARCGGEDRGSRP